MINFNFIEKLFNLAIKDFKIFSVIILGFIIVFFYQKIEGTNSEIKTDFKNCEQDLRNKDMKIDTLKDIINILVRDKMIDSIKNNKN